MVKYLYLDTEEENNLEKTPDEPDELKGFFEKRRDEGKEDEEIIREVFESNSNADIKKIGELTGLPSLTIDRIKGQVSIRRKRDSRASEKHLEEGEVSEPDARQLVAQNIVLFGSIIGGFIVFIVIIISIPSDGMPHFLYFFFERKKS